MEIKVLRIKRGLTQVDLARRVGVTQGAVSQWERGATVPTTRTLRRVAKELECSFDDLLDEGGDPNEN